MKNVKAATRKFSTDFSQVLCDGIWAINHSRFFWRKPDMFHIFCLISLLFVILLLLELGVHCFHIKLLQLVWKCNFHKHYNLYKTKTIFLNYSNVFQISIAKSVNVSFVEVTLFILFIFLQKRSYEACQILIQLKNE